MAAAGGASDTSETLIFVDVDGVLNVGIRDEDSPALLLNEQNCRYAEGRHRSGVGRGDSGSGGKRTKEEELVEKTVAVMTRPGGGDEDGATLRALACRADKTLVDLLVARLAAILAGAEAAAAAGAAEYAPGTRRVRVVLASNWRQAKYAEKVRRLERLVSRHLGRPFVFDGATRQGKENLAEDRLRCIGDFLRARYGLGVANDAAAREPSEEVVRGGCGDQAELRVLVLDDLFITPMDGWACDGTPIQSVTDAEAYLRGCAPSSAKVFVRVLHPYEEWKSHSGLRIQVAVGLTQQHCSQAAAFLGDGSAAAAAAAAEAVAQHRRRRLRVGGQQIEKRLESGDSLTKLTVWAADVFKGHARSSLTSSFPIEYIAVLFFLGLVLQTLIYST